MVHHCRSHRPYRSYPPLVHCPAAGLAVVIVVVMVVVLVRAMVASVMRFVPSFLELAPFSPSLPDVPFWPVLVRDAIAQVPLLLCESLNAFLEHKINILRWSTPRSLENANVCIIEPQLGGGVQDTAKSLSFEMEF